MQKPLTSSIATRNTPFSSLTDLEDSRTQAANGKIPLSRYEELNIVDPKSKEATAFSNYVTTLLRDKLKGTKFDIDKNPVQVLLSDSEFPNACFIKRII